MGCEGSKTADHVAMMPTPRKPPPEGDFKVNLERISEDQSFGVKLAVTVAKTFKVIDVFEKGLVPCYNAKRKDQPEFQVHRGDLILDVNGVFADPPAMKAQVARRTISFTVKRGKISSAFIAAAMQEEEVESVVTVEPPSDKSESLQPPEAIPPELRSETVSTSMMTDRTLTDGALMEAADAQLGAFFGIVGDGADVPPEAAGPPSLVTVKLNTAEPLPLLKESSFGLRECTLIDPLENEFTLCKACSC
eukprot:TRINITY_DN32152_c0_g1_i1.p1 TRINITY_DN32152_c0_g1~~TRINITY_DN32152_c0_g1_i1.p1  ORF type:complete len:249 (-),score=52.57 TRINITY_DN32152_c0_g1_i1:322-1068(-)